MSLSCSRRALNKFDIIVRHFDYLLQNVILTLIKFGMVLDQVIIHLNLLLFFIVLVNLGIHIWPILKTSKTLINGIGMSRDEFFSLF